MSRYYIEQPPTPERAEMVRDLAEDAAVQQGNRVGFGAWYEQGEKVLTSEEYAMLLRSASDDRNPGSVTMVRLFMEFCAVADKSSQRCHYCRTGVGSSCSCV